MGDEPQLVDLLRQVAETRGTADAFVSAGRRVNYADLWSGVARVSAWLESHGVRPGDRVAILMRNSPEYAMAYYGILGPKGLSKDIISKVHEAVKKTAELPDVRKRIEDTGSLLILNTPEQFAAQIKAEFEVYKKVVAEQKLTLE